MKRNLRWAVVVLMGIGAILTSCSNKLDKETAERDILSWSSFSRGKVTCSVYFSQESDKKWTFLTHGESPKCVNSLEKSGLAFGVKGITRQGWEDYTGEIRATERSWFSESKLVFDCADIKLLGVTSITTEENKATVKYSREVVLHDKLLTSISDCKVDKPDSGVAERQAHFTRDDAGNWASN